jgi:hypothetical protein
LKNEFFNVVRKRWLKTKEVYFLLKKPEVFERIGISKLNQITNLPQSGTFIVWDKKVGKNKWKKDGHEWVARKNNPNYVREDQENLKVTKDDLSDFGFNIVNNNDNQGPNQWIK